MIKRRRIRGKWAGLSAYTVSRLMGRSIVYTKKLLKDVPALDLDILGEMIFEERAKIRMTRLKKCLRNL